MPHIELPFRARAFQTSKSHPEKRACQDAIAWGIEHRKAAIADGVSNSAYQALWATLLVNSFVELPDSPPTSLDHWMPNWLLAQQEQWHEMIPWDSQPSNVRKKALRIGGQATFLGITLDPHNQNWSGIAIGDCELFQFDLNGKMTSCQPLISSEQFSNSPNALSSVEKDLTQAIRHVHQIQGTYQQGDVLVLATDAVACWTLKQIEQGWSPFIEVTLPRNQRDFASMISDLRITGGMVDDDSSILLLDRLLVAPISPLHGSASRAVLNP
jgi:hypothetical protein